MKFCFVTHCIKFCFCTSELSTDCIIHQQLTFNQCRKRQRSSEAGYGDISAEKAIAISEEGGAQRSAKRQRIADVHVHAWSGGIQSVSGK